MTLVIILYIRKNQRSIFYYKNFELEILNNLYKLFENSDIINLGDIFSLQGMVCIKGGKFKK